MEIILIRHGKTKGNLEKRYIGVTDEPLTDEGAHELRQIKYPDADIIISSPMLRCVQTAEIIYGKCDYVIYGLKECDFGLFENKSFEELKDDEYYQKWIDSGGKLQFPNGESMNSFSKRCINAFDYAVKKLEMADRVAFIIHGGTIMAIAKKYLGGDFYDYHLKNGEYMVLSLYK